MTEIVLDAAAGPVAPTKPAGPGAPSAPSGPAGPVGPVPPPEPELVIETPFTVRTAAATLAAMI